jgi:hypothetical protein
LAGVGFPLGGVCGVPTNAKCTTLILPRAPSRRRPRPFRFGRAFVASDVTIINIRTIVEAESVLKHVFFVVSDGLFDNLLKLINMMKRRFWTPPTNNKEYIFLLVPKGRLR